MKNKNVKLTNELPMSEYMFSYLKREYLKTTEHCVGCKVPRDKCINAAKNGKCGAMKNEINEILVFHTGSCEFATSRKAISKLLDAQHHLSGEQYIPETVDEVIENYLTEGSEFGEKNNFAASLMENLDEELGGEGFICQIEIVEE